MLKIRIAAEQLHELDVAQGLRVLGAEYGFVLTDCGADVNLALTDSAGDDLAVSCCGGAAELRFDFSRRFLFFRGFFLLLEQLGAGNTTVSIRETVYFDRSGPLLDLCQGNAALNMETFKFFLRRIAVMGLGACWLYGEDTFTVPEEPYFGYMRSRYSFEELRELDDYAFALGIELIPAVQTLAHLEDVLKWDVYLDLRECEDCLVPNDEKTYTFIRHILKAATAPFRTNRVHIGMDEAMGLGRGTTLDRRGLVPRGDIMWQHLRKVLEITKEMGLEAIVASDMFGANTAAQPENLPPVPAELPQGITYNFWNYYKFDLEWYRGMLRWHKKLGKVIFSGGVWTWYGFGPNWAKTLDTTNPALCACKQEGIREVIATTWGDSGTEADIRLTLWGLQLFAEHGYHMEVSEQQLRTRFTYCVRGDYDDFYALQYVDETPGVPARNPRGANPSKFLLWQDPLCGMFDANIRGLGMDAHYEKLERRLSDAVKQDEFSDVFELYRRLANVLAVKSEIGIRIYDAYHAGDRAALQNLADAVLPDLRGRMEALRQQHLRCWMQTYKPIGWEVLDLRYGALLARLDTAALRLRAYLAGETESLGELEEARLPFDGAAGIPFHRYTNAFGRIFSAGRIAPQPFLLRPKS